MVAMGFSGLAWWVSASWFMVVPASMKRSGMLGWLGSMMEVELRLDELRI